MNDVVPVETNTDRQLRTQINFVSVSRGMHYLRIPDVPIQNVWHSLAEWLQAKAIPLDDLTDTQLAA